MHGNAFSVYVFINSFRTEAGKISVGDRLVRIKALTNKIIFIVFFLLAANQIATPVIAMIKVGDSAL